MKMKILNLKQSIFSITIGLVLLFILSSLNCGGPRSFYNKTPAKLVFHIKFELTGYGFDVILNHTADEATNGEEEMLELHGQYSYFRIIRALEGEIIFFKTSPKKHVCSMQNTLVTLKITINNKVYIETSDPTSVWEEITLKRGIVPVYNYYHQK